MLYFQCLVCKQGYVLYSSQCVSQCSGSMSRSLLNGACVSCTDPNCVDCSGNPNTCLKCNIPTSLSNGTCLLRCDGSSVSVYSGDFSSQCLSGNPSCYVFLKSSYQGKPYLKCADCPSGWFKHLDRCVNVCPMGYKNYNGYCTCGGSANVTIHDQCLALPGCPISMYLDLASNSCLSCPFACISCYYLSCTACIPGYSLFLTPQAFTCRRNSPLNPCSLEYSWQRDNVCMLSNYSTYNTSNIAFNMILCLSEIPFCELCVQSRPDRCALCKAGYFLLNNECRSNCTSPMLPYTNVCILS